MDLFHQRKKKKTNMDKHRSVTFIRSQKIYLESNLHVFNSKTLTQMQECEVRYFLNFFNRFIVFQNLQTYPLSVLSFTDVKC